MKLTDWTKIILSSLMIFTWAVMHPGISSAAGDTYIGDSEIFGAASSAYQPNVLFLIDDSGSMADPPPNAPAEYDPNTTYGAQTVCTASLNNGLGGTAYASIGVNGGRVLELPPVVAQSNSGENRVGLAKPVRSSWNEGLQKTTGAVSAIWNGVAPKFLRVSNDNIKGTVYDYANIGGTVTLNTLSGVTVYAYTSSTNTTYSATTNSNGDYSISVPDNKTYTVTFTYPVGYASYALNYATYPPSPTTKYVVSMGTSTIPSIDFWRIPATYQISGSVSPAMAGVTITAWGAFGIYTTTTNSSGAYSIGNLPVPSYTVWAASSGYSFSPSSQFVNLWNSSTNSYQNKPGINFTATSFVGTLYQITGNIHTSGGGGGNPIQGVVVTVTNSSGTVLGTAVTNENGDYVLGGLAGGGASYTVTPALTGYTFSPSTSSVTINSSNKIANFTGSTGGGGGGGGGGSTINCASNTIYKYTASGNSQTYKTWGNLADGIAANCPDAQLALTTSGIWVGTLNSTNGACTSSDQPGTFFTGNWLNWANATVSTATGTSKMQIAKNVVTNLMLYTKNVRMGLITFDQQNKGGTFINQNGVFPASGTGYISYVDYTTTGNYNGTDNLHNMIAGLNALSAQTMTPLAGSLYESMLYFMGQTSFVHPSLTYTSPIQAGCQTNYVIVVTDGMSTSDNALVTGGGTGGFGAYCANGDCDGDAASNNNEQNILGIPAGNSGTDYMDDVAMYMHTHDMVPSMPGSNVTIYTVGFALDPADIQDLQGITLLTETATNGGGAFVNVKDSATLTTTLSSILGSILQVNTSFVAPVVPVSPANKTYSGNSVYIGLFLPQQNGFWLGNLKKYGYVNNQVVDITGGPATSTTGAFNSTAQSYWSLVQDGGLVKEGGVGAVLLNQGPANRYLYTYLSGTTITTSTNAFTTGNSSLTPAMLGFNTGVVATDAANFTFAVKFALGYDVGGTNPNGPRTWLLGDILHSEPAVINYNTNLSMIYVGSNDGMLHAFVDANPLNSSPAPTLPTLPSGVTDGGEVWGFIPYDVLPEMKNLYSSVHGYGVDGSPAVYYLDANGDGKITVPFGCTAVTNGARPSGCDQVILVFGERRGGSAYWALDVTDPINPVYLWTVNNTTTGFTELGESFSQAQIGPVNISGTITQVAFIGGGYDNATEDVLANFTADTKGRGIYAINLRTGALISSWTAANAVGSIPAYSMPSEMTLIDSNNNGTIDTAYVGDVHGQIWKYDVSSQTPSSWTAKIIFQSNPGNDASTGRKIFYPPDVTFESGYKALYFGTGDREHPLSSTSVVDRIYAVFDNPNYTGIIKEGGASPVSTNLNPLLTDVTITSNAIAAGWYIRLDNAVTSHNLGEKVLSAALVLNKVATYTTYAPLLTPPVVNSCQAVLGTGFVWSLNYLTGAAFFDYNKDGTVTNADRFKNLGSGIPSGVVVTITANGMSGLVGIGGGIEGVQLNTGSSLRNIYWHQPY